MSLWSRMREMESRLGLHRDQVAQSVHRLDMEIDRLRRENDRLESELRSQRATIDQLLIHRQVQGEGLNGLLRAEAEEEPFDPEELKRMREEADQLQKLTGMMFGGSPYDG